MMSLLRILGNKDTEVTNKIPQEFFDKSVNETSIKEGVKLREAIKKLLAQNAKFWQKSRRVIGSFGKAARLEAF
jgi:hypothetical protein